MLLNIMVQRGTLHAVSKPILTFLLEILLSLGFSLSPRCTFLCCIIFFFFFSQLFASSLTPYVLFKIVHPLGTPSLKFSLS